MQCLETGMNGTSKGHGAMVITNGEQSRCWELSARERGRCFIGGPEVRGDPKRFFSQKREV